MSMAHSDQRDEALEPTAAATRALKRQLTASPCCHIKLLSLQKGNAQSKWQRTKLHHHHMALNNCAPMTKLLLAGRLATAKMNAKKGKIEALFNRRD